MDRLIEELGGGRRRRKPPNTPTWTPRYVPDVVPPVATTSSARPAASSIHSISRSSDLHRKRKDSRKASAVEQEQGDDVTSGAASVDDMRAVAEALGGRSRKQEAFDGLNSPTYSIDEIIRRHTLLSVAPFKGNPLPEVPMCSSPIPSRSGSFESIAQPVTPVSSGSSAPSPMRDQSQRNVKTAPLATFEEAALTSQSVLERLEQEVEGRPARSHHVSFIGASANSQSFHKDACRHDHRREGSCSPDASSHQPNTAELVGSKRLTRLLALKRPGHVGQTVSLADVGDPEGYPVLVFLGLGCVRYLAGLFDELAAASGIRLICIDRWGLGKTTSIPESDRSLAGWANVVGEVLDTLSITKFGILAHSAGAPYALTVAKHSRKRVQGRVHLLAPWISLDVEAGELPKTLASALG